MNDYLRTDSKKDWNSDRSIEAINAGSLQRIADATEIMAKNYVSMQNDLEWYRRHYAEDRKTIKHLEHSRAGYKAALTKSQQKLREVLEAL